MAFDVAGNSRFQDDVFRIDTGPGPAPVVDMGAYERTSGVPCPTDWNSDGQVNSSDISSFLTTWLSSVQGGTLVADFNHDDTVNSSDISAFLTAWLIAVQGGC